MLLSDDIHIDDGFSGDLVMGEQSNQSIPFWMQGNFAPVSEEVTSENLKVTGEIPRLSLIHI